MNKILYNVTVGIYNLALMLAMPVSDRARKIIKGRRYWVGYLANNKVNQEKERSIWIHCASLGEFEQGRPVIEAIKKDNPGIKIFLSFFSPSGYEIRKNYPNADLVFYLPSDSMRNARILFNSMNPNLVIFVKYEYWYHYTRMANDRGIPVISVSTILRSEQLFFKSYGGFYRGILHMFNRFFVQNQATYDLLTGLGIKQTEMAGDTRFDRVRQICSNPKKIDIAATADSITLRGERKVSTVGKEVSYHQREREFGTFRRIINLPTKINTDKISASYRNGILTVVVPKAEEVKPKQIEIKTS